MAVMPKQPSNESTNEVTASPLVREPPPAERWAAAATAGVGRGGADNGGGGALGALMRKPGAEGDGAGGMGTPAGGVPGTTNGCWHIGQLTVWPAHASSRAMCWAQWGQEILNSLMVWTGCATRLL